MQDTNELTIKSTSKYTMLTVCNWETYQNDAGAINQPINKRSTSELTNNQPATNQQLTTNKNDKKVKNTKELKKEESPQAAGYPEQFEAIWKLYLRKGNKKPAYAQWQKLTESEKDDAVAALNPYFQEWPDFNFRKDFERYLSNRVFEGVLERKATDSLNIPKNTNGNTYGKPTQVLTTMPTDAEYAASENVGRDENGIPIF
jgi:hypothetical protein